MFTSVPGGLNSDEADAGYEAYSLLHHGTDKWGNKWPSYFISWGSGQNVLQSYLDIPVIDVGGLTSFTVRLVPAVLGVLAVVMLYYVLRFSSEALALAGSFVLAIMPWAVMSSRWGLESNILPFFILFGVFSFIYSQKSKYKKFLIPLSLVPFALALYAYIVAVFIIPILLLGIFIVYRKEILKEKTSYLISLIVAFIVSIPIDVFLIENFVLHRVPRAFTHLPFSAPLLLQNRLSQVNDQAGGFFWSNLHFYTSGFSDIFPWANMPGYAPAAVYLPLAVIGAVIAFKGKNKILKVFAWWFIASFSLSFIVSLDDIRANTFIIPLITLSALTVVTVVSDLKKQRRSSVLIAIVLLLVSYNAVFFVDYFSNYNNENNTGTFYFNMGLNNAIKEAQKVAGPNTNIYISDSINLNYVYALFYLKADSLDFQTHSNYSIATVDGSRIFQVQNYRHYYFVPDNPTLNKQNYVYVLKDGDSISCNKMVTDYKNATWRVGMCYK